MNNKNLKEKERKDNFNQKLELMLNDIKNDFDKLTTHLLENTLSYGVNFEIGPDEYVGSSPLTYEIKINKYASRKENHNER